MFDVSCACLFVVFSALCNTSNATGRSSISLLTAFSEFLVSPHVVATVGCVQLLVTSRHDVCTLCTLLPKVCPMFRCERVLLKQSSICRRVRLVLSETTHSHTHTHTHTHSHIDTHAHTFTHTNTHTFTHSHTCSHTFTHRLTHTHTHSHLTHTHIHTSHNIAHTHTHSFTSTAFVFIF